MVGLVVHAAGVQDRDGAPEVLRSIRTRWPWLAPRLRRRRLRRPETRDASRRLGDWTLEIVKRSDTAKGFEVLPRRWVVERTLAWLGRCRRLAKDWEKSIASAQASVLVAHIRLLTRRLARYCHVARVSSSGSAILLPISSGFTTQRPVRFPEPPLFVSRKPPAVKFSRECPMCGTLRILCLTCGSYRTCPTPPSKHPLWSLAPLSVRSRATRKAVHLNRGRRPAYREAATAQWFSMSA